MHAYLLNTLGDLFYRNKKCVRIFIGALSILGGESSKKEGKKKEREMKDMERGTERRKEEKKQNPGKT